MWEGRETVRWTQVPGNQFQKRVGRGASHLKHSTYRNSEFICIRIEQETASGHEGPIQSDHEIRKECLHCVIPHVAHPSGESIWPRPGANVATRTVRSVDKPYCN